MLDLTVYENFLTDTMIQATTIIDYRELFITNRSGSAHADEATFIFPG
jgi:hypothetical protein